MSRNTILVILILLFAAFLRLYQLQHTMMFIGDQAWFYLSARDALLHGQIPLIGIPSSHPWLHQGAYWTYLLMPLLGIGGFNPLVPAYVVAILGVATVFLLYKITSQMVSQKVALIAAALYATSPLIVFHERMPYHTSLISILTLLFIYAIFLWTKGRRYGFPLTILCLALLYNFQISTTPLLAVLLVFVIYGFWKKTTYFKSILHAKVLLFSFFAWFIPMIPMLLYDVSHGFPQTVKFVLWVGYRFALLFGFPNIHPDQAVGQSVPFLPFTKDEIQQLIFLPNAYGAIALLLISIVAFSYIVYKEIRRKHLWYPIVLIYISFIIPFLCYLLIKTPSGAYFPMFFPTSMIFFAVLFERLTRKLHFPVLAYIGLFLYVCLNSTTFVSQNFMMGKFGYGPTYDQRLEKSKEIVKKTDGMRYNIVGKGPGSQFESYTMNYQYLTWWLGHGPSNKPEKLKIPISDTL